MATLGCLDVSRLAALLPRLGTDQSRGCIVGTTVIAFIVALACPVFDSLVGLMGSLCGTPLAM